jgi:hypothetical protein
MYLIFQKWEASPLSELAGKYTNNLVNMASKGKNKKLDESDDNYDDDFEAYGDDFEAEEQSPPPKPTASAAQAKSTGLAGPVGAKPQPPPPAGAKPFAPIAVSNAPVSSVSRASPSIDNAMTESDIAQLRKSMEIENNEALAKRQTQSKNGDGHHETKR